MGKNIVYRCLRKIYRILKKILSFLKFIKKNLDADKITCFPKVIQFPITYKCNFDCVMCGMRNLLNNDDFSINDIRQILKDKAFSKVEGVGLNGGEPFLRNDLIECIDELMECLPKLSYLNIISNGYFTEKILSVLPEIKSRCKVHNVFLDLTLSLDAVGELQDFHRGKKNSFGNLVNTVEKLIKSPCDYYDNLAFNCTITKYNIFNICEVENFAAKYGIHVEYNIAAPNVRIDNKSRVEDFYVFNDPLAKQMAIEFFYKLFRTTNRGKYYALYLFLKEKKRYSNCPCMNNEWITLTPDSNISFCASHSKLLGSAKEKSAYRIIKENKKYLKSIKKECSSCSTYISELNFKGSYLLYKENKKQRF
ncbi:MAG: radical SAM protein [Treponema sp.]|nr:radical SAM protein [Treponema sp.]